jgi:hypothetical protein
VDLDSQLFGLVVSGSGIIFPYPDVVDIKIRTMHRMLYSTVAKIFIAYISIFLEKLRPALKLFIQPAPSRALKTCHFQGIDTARLGIDSWAP